MTGAALTFDGYVRVSRVSGRSGGSYRSPSDQRSIIESLAEKHGLVLGEIVVEEDVSGKKTTEDRELGRLVQKIKDGESGGLVVWNVKRYSRNWADGIVVADEIFKSGGRLLSEDFQYDGKFARTILSFLLEIAEGELEERRSTWKRATEGAIERGVYVGITPVGFDRLEDSRLRQNADAPAVRQVFLSRASGRSWNRLADDLEAAGVRTATGSTGWHINSVRSLVGNPIYKGSLQNRIEHHFPEYAIVTPSEWRNAQPLPEAPGARRDHGQWAVLGGLVWCAGCGGRLTPNRTTRTDGRTYSYYQCRNRGCTAHARATAEEIEALVVEEAVSTFEEIVASGAVTIGDEPDVEKVTALEQEIEDAQVELAAFLGVARASDPGFEQAVEERRAAVERARAALTDETGSAVATVTPAQWRESWHAWSVEERREALRHIVARVVVSKTGARYVEGATTDEKLGGSARTEPSKALGDRVEVEYRY